MKHTLCILQSLLTGALIGLNSCSSPPSVTVEDLILADAFGVTLPQNQSQEIANLKAEVAALKEAK